MTKILGGSELLLVWETILDRADVQCVYSIFIMNVECFFQVRRGYI